MEDPFKKKDPNVFRHESKSGDTIKKEVDELEEMIKLEDEPNKEDESEYSRLSPYWRLKSGAERIRRRNK